MCISIVAFMPTTPASPTTSASSVGRAEVAALHHRLRDTSTTANATVRTLSTLFTVAETWEFVPPGRNPCRSIRLYKEHARERFLTVEEYRRLGRVLKAAEADRSVWPPAVAAIRLLVLTGCRHGEITSLRWDDVDRTAGEIRLRDAKAGPRRVPLTAPVASVLAGIARVPGNTWGFVEQTPGTRLTSLRNYWHPIRAKAGLDDVRLHDLRHNSGIRLIPGRPVHGYRELASLQHVASAHDA